MAEALAILWPAALAGLLILATHVPLGRLVLRRGIVFIDLAIAQVAGLGVVVADMAGWAHGGLSVQLSAAGAALAASALLIWTERRLGPLQEAMIGIVFVVAASVEILLLSFHPHGAEHLKDMLVGQILWVSPADLPPVAILYGAILGLCALVDLGRHRVLFHIAFALAVTASVQLGGVFLVFAALILPAFAVQAMPPRRQLVAAYAVGAAGFLLGLGASAAFDLPTGAAAVCGLALVALPLALRRR